MKACNVFNPITLETGNFLMFSQYADDLARSSVDSSYTVRPSRFICLGLTDGDVKNSTSLTNLTDPVMALPGFFQNYFENGIAVAKTSMSIDKHNFSVAFWQKMTELTQESTMVDICSRIKYIGNISIESWQDGFADILLDITSGTKQNIVKFNDKYSKYSSEWTKSGGIVAFRNNCGSHTYSNDGNYIIGWTVDENIPISGSVPSSANIGIGTTGNIKGLFDTNGNNTSIIDEIFDYSTTSDDPFSFNTIVLLYDVVNNSNGATIARDIPLGIYFTGTIVDGSAVGNQVTIYPSHTSAYGAGSGWSLRVSTRFSPTPHGYLKVEEVATESGALYNTISALMAANAESIKSLQKFVDNTAFNSQTLKDIYSIFRNNKTNVPYIKNINGVSYWFVNGRNTGVTSSGLPEVSLSAVLSLFEN